MTAEIGVLIAAVVLAVTLAGIIYRAGSKLSEIATSLKPLVDAKLPERIAVVESKMIEHHDAILRLQNPTTH